MMTARLKLRNSKGELRWDVTEDESLHLWIDDKIPMPPPDGQRCELLEVHEGEELPTATAYMWKIEGDHVCYSYVCEGCEETLDFDSPDPEEYPTTDGGYAVAPRHCS